MFKSLIEYAEKLNIVSEIFKNINILLFKIMHYNKDADVIRLIL